MSVKFPAWFALIRKVGGSSCPPCHVHDEFATLWLGPILKGSLFRNLMSLFLREVLGVTVGGVGGGG